MPQFLGLIFSPGAEYSALRSCYQIVTLPNNRHIVCGKLLCILIILMVIMSEAMFIVPRCW